MGAGSRCLLLPWLLLLALLGRGSLGTPLGTPLGAQGGEGLAGNTSMIASVPGTQRCTPLRAPIRTANSCPRNWLYHRGYCYGYFAQRRSQGEAEEECNRYGPSGTLASIHSLGASNVLAEYLEGQRDRSNVWIGLKDEEHIRRWKWSDQSPLDYERWDWGQPNNLRGDEWCVVLEASTDFQFWHDYPCQDRFAFLCQHQL